MPSVGINHRPMKNYSQLKTEKLLIEQHIAFLKQQYLNAIMPELEWNQEMDKATQSLRKVNKQLNS